jgi:hypothetical protein
VKNTSAAAIGTVSALRDAIVSDVSPFGDERMAQYVEYLLMGAAIGQGTVTARFTRTENFLYWTFREATYTLQDSPFRFTGFFSPVDNDPVLNMVKADAGIPLKLNLDGDQGLDIFQAGFPASQPIACDSFAVLGSLEDAMSAGQSGLTYAPSVDQYTCVWKTEKS